MGMRPDGAQIDRIDNNGPYSPENCRWVTAKQQQRNRRNNVIVEWKGKRQCLSEWAEELGLKINTICMRLNHYNWSIDRALSTPEIRGLRDSKGKFASAELEPIPFGGWL
jgi:hypothetical protein